MTSVWHGSLFDVPPAPPAAYPARLLDGLNPAQHAAVAHDDGPMLVLAGAGSGKTRVLTTRIARLIAQRGIPPGEILSVTFTNKAAGEMRERIGRLLGEEPRGMWSGTFHSLGARLLRRYAPLVGRTAAYTIYDEDDALTLCRRVMERRHLDPKAIAPKAVLAAISDAKNALVTASEYASLARDPFAQAVAGVYGDLDDALQRANAVSFDDLLVLPVRLLEQHEPVRAELQRRFRQVLVDEYQDTNRAQYRFVQLVGAAHGNVMVVGDDDQSIYGWRGADIRNILDFERDFPGAAVVRLEENYRSTPQVLAVANAVIAGNTARRGKTLRATRPAGEPVVRVGTLDERDEADFVADTILDRVGRGGVARNECAVLYRTNAQSRAFEDAFRRRGIPYRLVGAVRFYDRREIRDLMAYLKLVANPADDEAFRRAVGVPKRGLGDTSVAQLAEVAREARVPMLEAAGRPDLAGGFRPAAREGFAAFAHLIGDLRARALDAAVDELLRALVGAIRYEDHLRAEGPDGLDRLDNVRELIAGAAEVVADDGGEVGLTPLDHFLQQATLVAGADALDPSADAVTMMTMHNAKGLEYPLVCLTGLEDGLFPLARAAEDPSQLEEERRLFYVGVTRAERTLFLTHAEQRRRNGEFMACVPSRFLHEIPRGLVLRTDTRRVLTEGRGRFGAEEPAEGGWRQSDGSSGRRRSAPGPYGSVGFGGNAYDGRSRLDAGRSRARSLDPGSWRGGRGDEGVAPAPEDESQDVPALRIGERVRHAKFGGGTIAEITGSGRDAKVRIDFDDDEIGRKTLVIAQARLERGWE
jgi:DNA helicase-2/ATP-dependent DNA helicase PcrA